MAPQSSNVSSFERFQKEVRLLFTARIINLRTGFFNNKKKRARAARVHPGRSAVPKYRQTIF
jgi:hypothetical protein